MQIYVVGGYVRDKVLGRQSTSNDQDFVVTGSTVAAMRDLGFLQVGDSFPVFLHPETREEYALARQERTTGDAHTDFEYIFIPDITIDKDAQRRDFTVNALYMPDGSDKVILDPTGRGLQDCADGVLRHVGESFIEDPLRVVRCARFAAQLGFSVAPETMDLLVQMVQRGMLKHLPRERIDNEFVRAMSTDYDSRRFLEVMFDCGALDVLYPEIAAYHNCVEKTKYHATGTTWGHVLAALDVARSSEPQVKTAIVYHDIYKPIAYLEKTAENYIAHDDEYALDYLRQVLSQRKFDVRTKKLCKVALKSHMKVWRIFDGMAIKKWVDLIGGITGGFRNDCLHVLTDFLEVCRADAISDKPVARYSEQSPQVAVQQLHDYAMQTFTICSKIQARDIPDYADLHHEQLKAELRRVRIHAVAGADERI
ncbi:MAG: multifunctional CCA tRNA nucleotidyl transferase/2'3'-cyclic phosphodiesterase/2'nucleotidase/phosphatase [Coriobacteriia bacterium]|nr:multifunctional CCA tRNA nucleotidyl transferase/2'3'-cyclic phosphodiesterase/2'nucleotidase/phosphatase [Coriobacteriia bacterium]